MKTADAAVTLAAIPPLVSCRLLATGLLLNAKTPVIMPEGPGTPYPALAEPGHKQDRHHA